MKKLCYILSLLAVISFLPESLANVGEPVVILKAESPIDFDGAVNESVWDNIEPLSLTTQSPVYHAEPISQTEIRLTYDNAYIYLAGKMYVNHKDDIVSNSKRRDAMVLTDWFGIVIDSYNDKQNALGFFTTPAGNRMDANVLNDANGSNPLNLSWNNFWDVEVTQDEHGWYAEIRIPWSSLPFEAIDGQVKMGITTWRYAAKYNEIVISPDISPEYGEMAAWRPSLAQEYIFQGISPKKPFYITPYALAGFSQEKAILEASPDRYTATKDIKREVGLDLKYGISNNWTVDLSLNTDFAQVEADNQQVNLTRFNLFFPEKRLFFQERSGLFDFNFPRGNKLFYSRRIGINADGAPIPIIGGVRLTGRSGGMDVGFLNMQTADSSSENGENFTVARVLKQVINKYSNVGFILTHRNDLEGQHNTAFGFDTTIRLFGQTFWTMRAAQTIDNDAGQSLFGFDNQKAFTSISKRSQKGFVYAGSLTRVGKDFNPRMGFERRSNYFRHGQRIGYNWFPDSQSAIFKHGPQGRGDFFWNNTSLDLETMNYRVGYAVQWRNFWAIDLGYRRSVDVLTEVFELSDDASIPLGRYTFSGLNAEFTTNQTLPVSAILEIDQGQFYDGERTSVSLTPLFQASSSLELSGSYQYNKINFSARDQAFISHLISANTLVMFNTKLSISALLQYNSLDKNFLGNVRLRYNPREGNDLFIVYNDLLNTERSRIEGPTIPLSTGRTILLKYSYTFSL